MKKIPTLFKREFDNHIPTLLREVTPGMEWVLDGEGVATVKLDGSATAIINRTFYKRYDAKRGKEPPKMSIPCCPPDPVTGHWPCWVPVDPNNPADKHLYAAYCESGGPDLPDWTYEAIGKHFCGNPYKLDKDILLPHGGIRPLVERSFDGIKKYLEENEIEGLVFWKDGEPQCKIRRKDFGLPWPVK